MENNSFSPDAVFVDRPGIVRGQNDDDQGDESRPFIGLLVGLCVVAPFWAVVFWMWSR